jgi:hypothetical protein
LWYAIRLLLVIMGDLREEICVFEHEPGMRPGWLSAVLAFFVGCGSDLRSLLVETLFWVYWLDDIITETTEFTGYAGAQRIWGRRHDFTAYYLLDVGYCLNNFMAQVRRNGNRFCFSQADSVSLYSTTIPSAFGAVRDGVAIARSMRPVKPSCADWRC